MVPAEATPAVAIAPPLVDAELMLLEGPAAREANLLELQVSELLSEIRFDAGGKVVQAAFLKLRKTLLGLPEGSAVSAPLPGPLGAASIKSNMTFRPPESVELAESSMTDFVARPVPVLDVLVTMPGKCFLHKDHLDHRYHAKRAKYLSHVALALGCRSTFKHQRWDCLHADPRKPVLLVTPKLKAATAAPAFSFRLLPVLALGLFPVEKLAPDRNNIRSICKLPGSGEGGNAEPKLLPTPHYNNSIAQDLLPTSAAASVTSAARTIPAFEDAMLLLKVWLRQHGLEGSADDLGMGVISAFAAHLAHTESLSPAMSALQSFKAVLRGLAAFKPLANGCCMKREAGPSKKKTPSLAAFKTVHEVSLIDPSGWLNVAAHVSKAALRQASLAAKRTLAILDKMSSGDSAFQAVFLPRHLRTSSNDYFWRISSNSKDADEDGFLGSDQVPWRQQEAEVAKLCKQAFSDRVSSIRVFSRSAKREASLSPPALQSGCMLVAARANPEAATRLVDIGPSADSPEAKPFREFWGDKSEMRRFQDGRICEAVAWEAGPAARHLVLDQIMRYAFEKHMPGLHVEGFAGVLDWAVEHRTASADSLVATWRDMDAALLSLSRQLRSMDSLALKIVAVQPLGALTRHTALRGPLQHPALGGKAVKGSKTMRCVEPVELLVQLEGSGKWYEQPEAFRKMKAALGVQLAEELQSGFGLRAVASEACVDVFADGFAFRLFLSSDRDTVLARRVPELAADVLPRQHRAAHHGRVSQIAAAHPSFRAAARLALRWSSAHLLSNQVRPEAVELLVAAAYCPKSALGPPGSPLAGFLGFLRTIAHHPWAERLLIVDPDASMDAAQLQAAAAAYAKAKEDGTAPGLPIATPTDPASAHWTARYPSRKLVVRMVALASRGLALLEEAMLGGTAPATAVAAAVFDAGPADFDAVVLLRREALPNADWALRLPAREGAGRRLEHALSRAGFPGDPDLAARPLKAARAVLRDVPEDVVAEWGSERIAKELLVGFDPVEHFVGLLEQRFGHLGVFCSDFDGGPLIAIKWHPASFQPTPFTPEKAHTSMPLDLRSTADGRPTKRQRVAGANARLVLTVPHLPRIMHEIREMGAGIVSDVRLRCSTDL